MDIILDVVSVMYTCVVLKNDNAFISITHM